MEKHPDPLVLAQGQDKLATSLRAAIINHVNEGNLRAYAGEN
jgi:hypothetical protein